jgi:hypothetical protein
MCFLFLGNSRNRACTCAGEASNAYVLIALGLSICIERESCNRANTYTSSAADAHILINCYGHDDPPSVILYSCFEIDSINGQLFCEIY